MPTMPRLTHRVVGVLLRLMGAQAVRQDLEDSFAVDCASRLTPRQARRRFRSNAWSSLREVAVDRLARGLRIGGAPGRAALAGGMLHDVRIAARTLRRRPGFAATATLTLALGIGANTAIFSVVDGVLFRPLPVADADELVAIWTYDPEEPGDLYNSSGPNIRDWQQRAPWFDGVFAWNGTDVLFSNREGLTERVEGVGVTHEAFSVLGVPPALGRAFGAEDEGPGAERVAVLTHGFWSRRFGGRDSAVGQVLILDGEPTQVVGVMPPSFAFPGVEDADLILPMGAEITDQGRDMVWLGAMARLGDGTSPAAAQASMDALHLAIQREHPVETVNSALRVVPLREDLTGDVRPALLVLLGATGFLLLMACANVANLLLARAAGRSAEVALRQSLGASRWRIVRQQLIESSLLAGGAAVVGVGLAILSRDALMALAPDGWPGSDAVVLNGQVLAFAVASAVATGLGFGLVPALMTSGARPGAVLHDSGRGAIGSRHRRTTRSTLVVVQVAVATLLVVGAGVLLQSLERLAGVDAGFDVGGVVTADISLPPAEYTDADRRAAFYAEAIRRVEALPGVAAAGVTIFRPLADSRVNYEVRVEGRPRPEPGDAPLADIGIVSDGFLDALGIGIRRGRRFQATDTRDTERVALINETMARQVFGTEDPLGRRVALVTGSWDDEPSWRRVVGVVDDIRQYSLDRAPEPTIYSNVIQQPQYFGEMAARVSGDPTLLATPMRQALLDIEPAMPVPTVRLMEAERRESLAEPRFAAVLLTVFAGLALSLAAVGIYGVLSYTVSDRTREIGLRLAFGAGRGRILGQVLREGLSVAGAGVLVGLTGAFLASRLIAGMVFEVDPANPVRLAVLGLLLLMVAALACYLPAARAARLDAAVALRGE